MSYAFCSDFSKWGDLEYLQDFLEETVVEFSPIVGEDLDRTAIYGYVVFRESFGYRCCFFVGDWDGRKEAGEVVEDGQDIPVAMGPTWHEGPYEVEGHLVVR